MGRMAMNAIDIDPAEADRAEDMYRARDKERLKLQYETGDLRAARDRIITSDEREEIFAATRRELAADADAASEPVGAEELGRGQEP
jgi:CPA2 family monovalent cation:H+ antiporter-2/glutathione-regulated potassium-efflux system protein KefB